MSKSVHSPRKIREKETERNTPLIAHLVFAYRPPYGTDLRSESYQHEHWKGNSEGRTHCHPPMDPIHITVPVFFARM
jgi:hypothetical protein